MCEVDQGKQVRLVCCEALEKFRTAADARPKVQKRKKKLLLMVSVGVGVGVGVVVAWLACVGLCGASDVPCGQRSNAELVLDTSTGQRTCVCVANHVCSLVGPSGAKAYCGAGTINIGDAHQPRDRSVSSKHVGTPEHSLPSSSFITQFTHTEREAEREVERERDTHTHTHRHRRALGSSLTLSSLTPSQNTKPVPTVPMRESGSIGICRGICAAYDCGFSPTIREQLGQAAP